MQQCPWQGFEPATISFCEEQLCAWITQPANTWSNIGFIIIGIFIHRLASRSGQNQLKVIGISSIVVGFGSGMFHASSTFFFEVFDLLGMFMIGGMLLCLNLQRLLSFSNRTLVAIYLSICCISVALMFVWRPSGIATFSTLLTLACMSELLLHLRRDEISYKYFVFMSGTFALSFLFWGLDISKVLCRPDNHILTGHAVWHLLNATAIYFIYKFYEQFAAAKKGTFSMEAAR